MSSENFFSRWSKRKQAARAAEPPPEDTVSPPGESSDAAPEATASLEASEGIPVAEAELSAEEIAALPPIADLTAETDISVFLRKSVPAPLRKAALRRAWALDPKIRDFVGDAREYAYDWNTPGGVPGFGPLQASEEIARMAARIVGREEPEADQAVDKPGIPADARSKSREQLSSQDAYKAETEVVPPQENRRSPHEESPFSQSAEAPRVIVPRRLSEADNRRESAAATEQPSVHEPGTDASPRRHGGAMPV